MATNSYRKDYKRKWISACRTLTKYNNNAKRLPIDQCVQSPPTKFQRVERRDKIDFNVDDCDEPLSPTILMTLIAPLMSVIHPWHHVRSVQNRVIQIANLNLLI